MNSPEILTAFNGENDVDVMDHDLVDWVILGSLTGLGSFLRNMLPALQAGLSHFGLSALDESPIRA
jgi:hypothetical protein